MNDDLMRELAAHNPVPPAGPAIPDDPRLTAVLAADRVLDAGAPPVELRRGGKRGRPPLGIGWVIGIVVVALALGGLGVVTAAGLLHHGGDKGISPMDTVLDDDQVLAFVAYTDVGAGQEAPPALASSAQTSEASAQSSETPAPSSAASLPGGAQTASYQLSGWLCTPEPGAAGGIRMCTLASAYPVCGDPPDFVSASCWKSDPKTATADNPVALLENDGRTTQAMTPCADSVCQISLGTMLTQQQLANQPAPSAATFVAPPPDITPPDLPMAEPDSDSPAVAPPSTDEPATSPTPVPPAPGTEVEASATLLLQFDAGTVRADSSQCLVNGTGSYTMGADGSWSFDAGALAGTVCGGRQVSQTVAAAFDILAHATSWTYADNGVDGFYVFTSASRTAYFQVRDAGPAPAFGSLSPVALSPAQDPSALIGTWYPDLIYATGPSDAAKPIYTWGLTIDDSAITLPPGCDSGTGDGYVATADGRFAYGSDSPITEPGCPFGSVEQQSQNVDQVLRDVRNWAVVPITYAVPDGTMTDASLLVLFSQQDSGLRVRMVLQQQNADGTRPPGCPGVCLQWVSPATLAGLPQPIQAAIAPMIVPESETPAITVTVTPTPGVVPSSSATP